AAQLALPLAQVHSLPAGASPADVEALAARTGVTRFPVRDDGAFNGYIHLKDVLTVPDEQRDEPLPSTLLRPLPTIHGDLRLPAAIETLRATHSHLARVADAAQPHRIVGVLALDDVL